MKPGPVVFRINWLKTAHLPVWDVEILFRQQKQHSPAFNPTIFDRSVSTDHFNRNRNCLGDWVMQSALNQHFE
jgi:hypothetical protein